MSRAAELPQYSSRPVALVLLAALALCGMFYVSRGLWRTVALAILGAALLAAVRYVLTAGPANIGLMLGMAVLRLGHGIVMSSRSLQERQQRRARELTEALVRQRERQAEEL